ncbi:hypothetical protein THAOC_29270 [Thalassiosira oceanica]|uniref:Uncharacterized protein n=1 Tax=Thalassiosira oceanica TaxID=159749 RepID=K0RGX6_THAOC|nr:hypothetical protein THAOC_29270 [Thalassiosira oceanica]|eukprot:EJK51549.1 hypothetical protein THAOC_29270 [Thalassiosira oceanica]
MAIAGPQHAPGTTAPSTMKLGGISSEKEAVNFLIGEVPDVNIARYVHHLSGCPSACKSPYCSPWHSRLQLPGRPTGCQRQRFHPTAKAIFEVKTSGTKRYNHNMNTPIQRKVAHDRLFVANIVGDGTCAVVGPFQAALGGAGLINLKGPSNTWSGDHSSTMTVNAKEGRSRLCYNNSAERSESILRDRPNANRMYV